MEPASDSQLPADKHPSALSSDYLLVQTMSGCYKEISGFRRLTQQLYERIIVLETDRTKYNLTVDLLCKRIGELEDELALRKEKDVNGTERISAETMTVDERRLLHALMKKKQEGGWLPMNGNRNPQKTETATEISLPPDDSIFLAKGLGNSDVSMEIRETLMAKLNDGKKGKIPHQENLLKSSSADTQNRQKADGASTHESPTDKKSHGNIAKKQQLRRQSGSKDRSHDNQEDAILTTALDALIHPEEHHQRAPKRGHATAHKKNDANDVWIAVKGRGKKKRGGKRAKGLAKGAADNNRPHSTQEFADHSAGMKGESSGGKQDRESKAAPSTSGVRSRPGSALIKTEGKSSHEDNTEASAKKRKGRGRHAEKKQQNNKKDKAKPDKHRVASRSVSSNKERGGDKERRPSKSRERPNSGKLHPVQSKQNEMSRDKSNKSRTSLASLLKNSPEFGKQTTKKQLDPKVAKKMKGFKFRPLTAEEKKEIEIKAQKALEERDDDDEDSYSSYSDDDSSKSYDSDSSYSGSSSSD